MRRLPALAFWLLAPAAMALWLLVATPSRWIGIDSGALGAALMLTLAWLGLWLASRIGDDASSQLSPGEQKNAVALAFTGLVVAIMLFKADLIMHAGSVAELREVGRPVVMLLVGWIVFAALLRTRFGARVQRDERDIEVERAADAAAHTTLAVAVLVVAIMLGFSPRARIDALGPLAVANLLMFSLVSSTFVGHAVAAWHYRRDRA